MSLPIELVNPVPAAATTAPAEQTVNQKLAAQNIRIQELRKEIAAFYDSLQGIQVQYNAIQAKIPVAPDEEIADLFAEGLKISNNKERISNEINEKSTLLESSIQDYNVDFRVRKNEIQRDHSKAIYNLEELKKERALKEKESQKNGDACLIAQIQLVNPEGYIAARHTLKASKEELQKIDATIKKAEKEIKDIEEQLLFYLDKIPVRFLSDEEYDKLPEGIRVEIEEFSVSPDPSSAHTLPVFMKVSPETDKLCCYELIAKNSQYFGDSYQNGYLDIELRAIPGQSVQNPKRLLFIVNIADWKYENARLEHLHRPYKGLKYNVFRLFRLN